MKTGVLLSDLNSAAIKMGIELQALITFGNKMIKAGLDNSGVITPTMTKIGKLASSLLIGTNRQLNGKKASKTTGHMMPLVTCTSPSFAHGILKRMIGYREAGTSTLTMSSVIKYYSEGRFGMKKIKIGCFLNGARIVTTMTTKI